MAYDSKMEKFDYTFLTCRGKEATETEPAISPNDEATQICSEMGKRGYKVIRWYIREDGVNHIVMEKRYRG